MSGFKVGDKVRFRPSLTTGEHRNGQIGTVIAVEEPAGATSPIVDVRFDEGPIERGVRIAHLERA